MKPILTDAKQIVCVLPKGTGSFIEAGLIDDFGIRNANFHHARGVSRISSRDGLGAQQEEDVLEVAVESDRAEEVFDYIFHRGEMHKPHNGIIYMAALPKLSVMQLPELDDGKVTTDTTVK